MDGGNILSNDLRNKRLALGITVKTTVLVLLLAGGAEATTLDSCTTISEPGTYVLIKSIINSTNSTCMRITSSDVVLDGAGSTIDGVDGFETNGVYAFNESKNIKNVTVKNLTVTDWYYGINYNCAQGGEISNNNARSNTNAGIYLDGSGGSILINNSVSSSNYGIYLDGSIRFTLNNNTRNSSKNILINNNVSLSKYAGIYLLGSKENTLTGNNASSNSDGISLNEYSGTLRVNEGGQFVTYSLTAYSSDNILDGNIAINNSDTGISLRSSDNNTLTVNAARSNKIGFSLSNSSNNTLINNTADSNSWYGFTLWYSSNNNTLNGSNASNNEDGIKLQSSGNNTLKNNRMRNNIYNFELYGSKDSDFENTIDTDNTIDGKPIYYMKRKTNAVYDSSSNAGVFYCIWCWNVTVKDIALSGNSHGVFFWRTNNSRIENINTSRNQESGIKIDRSFNNSLINNTVISNTQGIFLGYSDNNSLFNNTAISNGVQGGVYLSYSNYNFLTDNIVKSNKGVGGTYLEYSSYNTVTDNIINYNPNNGLNLYYSGHNIISNNSLSFNGGGFDLMNSNENTIMNNNISSNYGNSVYSSNNNTIYNNYFNNTNNIISYGMISGNYWNITRTVGANIIGGYTLGGNFWADLNGTGISQICPDADMDGICDSSYALDSNNTDHLPLSSAQVIIDITPPASISNLRNISYATNYINWTWIDPIDTDFSYTIVYLDGSYRTNISKGIQFYNITGFSDSSVHTISTRTVDMAGNLNLTWVNHTATTSQASQPYDILSYYRSLGSNPDVLETTDLLRAADDWSDDRMAPGFSAPITTQQLLVLADEWSKT